jgi:hypothetical protein
VTCNIWIWSSHFLSLLLVSASRIAVTALDFNEHGPLNKVYGAVIYNLRSAGINVSGLARVLLHTAYVFP